MTLAYAVMGETEHGVLVLRTFPTREQAEDHPVKLSLWKRVWVEPVSARLPPKERSLRLPWTAEYQATFTYLRDADGSRVASLHGTFEERQGILSILRERGVVA